MSYGDGGPRLLRTSLTPEGLDSMKVDELQQVILANRLLMFSIQLFITLALGKRFMVLEHPGCPEGDDAAWLPSIWRLYILRALGEMGSVKQILIQQGLYDGHSPKPTMLFILCGELDARKILDTHKTRERLPPGLKMGFNKDKKEYATAALKSYPGPLCLALANLANCWAHRYFKNLDSLTFVPMQKFLEYTSGLHAQFNLMAQRGADHHRSAAFN